MQTNKRVIPMIVVGAIVLWLIMVPLGISLFIDLRQERDEDFLHAVRSGEAKEIAALLAAGADPNVRELPAEESIGLWPHVFEVITRTHTRNVELTRTALSCACENRHAADVVKLLLDKGANLKADEASQQPALPSAARKGDVATVRILLEHGANIDIRDELSNSVLENAVASDNPELVRLLLDKGAKVEGSNQGPINTNSKNYETIRQMVANAHRQ